MASADATTHDIIESMSAFCLATSSSCEDAIRHFHHIRSKAIESRLTEAHSTHSSVVEAFNLYLRTLQRTAELISGRLSDTLGRLTAKPIMSDPAIQNMGELGIDILQGWVSDDIKHFLPWIKHDNVSKHDANKITKKWSKESFDNFRVQAGNVLKGSDDFSDLVDLRTELLEAWLPVQYSTPTHASLEVLQGLRHLISNPLVAVLRAQSEGLTSLGLNISSTITDWSDAEGEQSVPSLWGPDLTFLDFSEGAGAFKEEITNRMLGRSPAVLQVLDSYQTWMSVTQDRQTMIAELRRTKWEDVAEDEEDEEVEDVGGMLNDDDPHLLQMEHDASLAKGFASLHTSLRDALANMEGEHRASRAAFMMRIIREIRRRIPTEYAKEGRDAFAQDLIPKLQRILAAEIVCQLRSSILTRYLKRRPSKCPGRSLWEGDPQLPIQPSSMMFRFLRELTAAMEQQGQDLWNPDAVDEMKRQLVEQVVPDVRGVLSEMPISGSDQPVSNPDHTQESDDAEHESAPATESPPAQESDALQDCKIQLLFDLLYLSQALELRTPHSSGDDDDNSIKSVMNMLQEEHGSPDTQSLATRAQEYWTRTQLLFGLLA